MDPTIHRSGRVEVRGGTVDVISGQGSPTSLTVGPEPQVVGRHADCAMVLEDRLVSGMHMEVVATEKGLRVRDLASTNGTFLDECRIESILLTTPRAVRCGESVLEIRPGKPQRLALSKSHHFGRLVGASPKMRALFDRLERLASTTVSVLIHGETGTGKELVAEAIHEASDRAKEPFIVIDCTSIPVQLAESTLFGHQKGAFTGADSKRASPFVEAHGGTVFLDEIGELPLDVQPKLLRALEQRRIKPVGSNRYEPVDVRIIAATHRDLAPASNQGRFREDLYFRIARAHVQIPPLRERAEDIRALVRHMMEGLGSSGAFRRVPEKAFDVLERHPWPGNVRELHNLVEVALAYDQGGPFDLDRHLEEMLPLVSHHRAAHEKTDGAPQLPALRGPHSAWLDEAHRVYFGALYEESGGNLSEMARKSEVHRDTIRSYLHKLGIGKSARPKRPV